MFTFYLKLGSTLLSSYDMPAAYLSLYTASLNYFRLKCILAFLSRYSTYMGSFEFETLSSFSLYMFKYLSAEALSFIDEDISAKWNTSCKSITMVMGGAFASYFLFFKVYSHIANFL